MNPGGGIFSSAISHLTIMGTSLYRFAWLIMLTTCAGGPLYSRSQQSASPAPNVQADAHSSSPSAVRPDAKKPAKKHSHADDFLVRGTVFNEKSLSLPGARLRVRRTGEQKYRWESLTNSRGEFAVRVPQGSDYELVARAKGFAEQTRTVIAKNGATQESIAFQLEPLGEAKK